MKTVHGLGFASVLLVSASAPALLADPPVPFNGPAEAEPFTRDTILAADPIDAVRYGIQLLAAAPGRDFRGMTGQTGTGLGLFLEKHVSGSVVIQTRLDYLSYPVSQGPGIASGFSFLPANNQSLSANSAALSVDVRQYLPWAPLKSVYGLAGVTAIRYEFRTTYAGGLDQNGIPLTGLATFKGSTAGQLGWALGLGYDFDGSWALAARYSSVNINGSTLATTEAGLSYRF